MAVLFVGLLIACYYDYRRGRIPNLLLAVMFVIGWGYSAVVNEEPLTVISFPAECVGVMLLLYPLFKIGAIGAGDVKLYGICAGYLPRDKFLFFLFLSLLIAAIFSLLKMLKEQNAIERFCYLIEYVLNVVQTGSFHLYLENEKDRKTASVCLAGPIFCSVLLHWGGIY